MAERDVVVLNETAGPPAELQEVQSGDTYRMQADCYMVNNSFREIDRAYFEGTGAEVTAGAGTNPYVDITGNQTYNYTNVVLAPGVMFSGTHTLKQNGAIAGMGFLYRATPTIKNDSAASVTSFGRFYTLDINPVFEADTDTITFGVLNDQIDISINGTMQRSNGGSLSAAGWDNIVTIGSVSAGCTVTTKSALRVYPPTVNGTLTNNVPIRIADMSSAGTNCAHILYGTVTPPSGKWGIYQGGTSPNRFNAATNQPFLTRATNLTLGDGHHTVVFTGGAPTLPTAATANTGRHYIVYNATGSNMTVGGTILDAGSATVTDATGAEFVSNGSSGWYRLY